MADLNWINLVPSSYRKAFQDRVISISTELGINPNWLMQVMYAESRVNPQAKNIQQGRLIAAGLIQWTKASGYSPEFMLTKSGMEQLEYVRKYFLPYKGKMKSYYDVYAVVFFPALVGKPDDWILKTDTLSSGLIGRQNPAIDINKNGTITVKEFKEYVDKTSRGISFTYIMDYAKDHPKVSAGVILIAGGLLIYYIYFATKLVKKQ